jgi:hypothetical protein
LRALERGLRGRGEKIDAYVAYSVAGFAILANKPGHSRGLTRRSSDE